MRILKFNESSKRYPIKVSQNEFFRKKEIHRIVDFSLIERKTMREILTKKQTIKTISWSTSSDFIEIYSGRDFFEIVKLDDYWFTIIHETPYSIDSYYTCDEFEEVVNFLIDIV